MTDRIRRATQRVLASRGRMSRLTEELGSRIVTGELRPGELLSERMFADERRVSRTSFREAIKVLEGKGLVTSRQNTGTQVTERSGWHMFDPEVLLWRLTGAHVDTFILDFFEFRRSVEPAAAAAAASLPAPRNTAEIRRALDDMTRLEQDYPFGDEYVRADVRFHKSLLVLSDNEFFVALAHILEVPLLLSFTLTSSLQVGPSNRVNLHTAVVSAIEAGDPERARQASLALLSDVSHDVQRIIDEGSEPGDQQRAPAELKSSGLLS